MCRPACVRLPYPRGGGLALCGGLVAWLQGRLRSSKSNIFPKKSQRFAEVLADIYFFVYLQAEHPQHHVPHPPEGLYEGESGGLEAERARET